MVAGYWTNKDGLPLQFGTQKAIPELGGDYPLYGETREIETYICLAPTAFGTGALQVPGLPSSFSGTGFPIAAGIQSLTTLVPLQITAPVTAGNATGVQTITNPQIYFDKIEYECLIAPNAGTGGATGFSVGLATMNPTTGAFVQVTPNAGAQLGAITNASVSAGATYTFRPNANGTATAGGAGFLQYSTAAITNLPTAPAWVGNIPLVTNAITPLPNNAWISAIATGGTYSGANAAGLFKLRLNYTVYGPIVN